MRRKIGLSLSELPRLKFQVRTRARRGFSLIELLGVLAIMGVLAALTVPPIIRQLQQARTVNEEANLEEVARAIVEGIKATGTIPNPNLAPFDAGGWADVAYRYTTLTDDTAPGGGFVPGTLHFVFPVETAFATTARRIYLDPQLLIYLESLYGGLANPFVTPAGGWPLTTVGGVNFPNQALKMFIVSSSRPDFVLSCLPNGPNVQVAANNYGNPVGAPLIDQLASWIKAVNPATRFINAPGSAVENWTDDGHQYLHVKIVDLRPLFCRVELIDTACPPTATINIGSDTYLNPNVSFFGNLATFNIYDLNLAPINPARAISNNDRAALINPLPQFINRTMNLNPVNMTGRQNNPNTTPSTVTPVLNPQPRFRIPISGSVSPPPAGMFPANVQPFYVLKGTALQLWDDAAANPVLTTTIESDCSFKYVGNTWTRVD